MKLSKYKEQMKALSKEVGDKLDAKRLKATEEYRKALEPLYQKYEMSAEDLEHESVGFGWVVRRRLEETDCDL